MLNLTTILGLATFLLVLFHGNAERQVAHLLLDTVRDNRRSDPGEDEVVTLLGSISNRRDELYCTDSVYPNDIFCDVGSAIQPEHELTSISFEYANPSVRDSACTVNFRLASHSTFFRMEYSGGSCSERTPLLPMTRVAYVTAVKIGSRNPRDLIRCKKTYTNSGKIDKSRISNTLDRYRSPMKFTYYEGHCS